MKNLEFKSLVEMFGNKKRWTKFNYARDKQGRDVSVHDTDAIRFCLEGGLRRVYREEKYGEAKTRLEIAIWVLYRIQSIVQFNDESSTTIEDIRRVCKKAQV